MFESFASRAPCKCNLIGSTTVGKLYGWQAQAPLIHSLFQRFAELMSRISRNPVDFKATRICGWLGWVFRAMRLVVDRQVRHFRAPTRFKCLRFGFTIFLSAFYFVVVIFLLFFLFFFCIIFDLGLKFQFTSTNDRS